MLQSNQTDAQAKSIPKIGVYQPDLPIVEVFLYPGTTAFGRGETTTFDRSLSKTLIQEVLLTDQQVSRIHATLEFVAERGQLFITDLGSSNGTYVNGVRIRERTQIDLDSRIEIGLSTLMFLEAPLIEGVPCLTKENVDSDKRYPIRGGDF